MQPIKLIEAKPIPRIYEFIPRIYVVALDTINPKDETLLDWLEFNEVKVVADNGDQGAHTPEIVYQGHRDTLRRLIDAFWNDPFLYELIKLKV